MASASSGHVCADTAVGSVTLLILAYLFVKDKAICCVKLSAVGNISITKKKSLWISPFTVMCISNSTENTMKWITHSTDGLFRVKNCFSVIVFQKHLNLS